MCEEEGGTGPDCVCGRAMTDGLVAVMGDCCTQLKSGTVANNVRVGEQNSSCVVARSYMMLVRRYLSLRSCLRSCGQVLGPSCANAPGMATVVG